MAGKKNETKRRMLDLENTAGPRIWQLWLRVEEQARREWENWNDKIKDPNVKIGKFQLSTSGKTQFHLEFPRCDNIN